MKIGKQIKIISYYPPDSVDQLSKLAEITRISRAELLREALADLLKKHASTLRSAAGRKKGG